MNWSEAMYEGRKAAVEFSDEQPTAEWPGGQP